MRSLLLFCLLLLLPPSALADLNESRAQLDQIRARIEKTQAALSDSTRQQKNLDAQLKQLESDLKQLEQQTANAKQQLALVHDKIIDQEQLLKQTEGQAKQLRGRLESRLISLYKEGSSGPLKLLFSSRSPAQMQANYKALSRLLAYDQQLLGDYRQLSARQRQELARLQTLDQEKSHWLEQSERQRQTAAAGRDLKKKLLGQTQQATRALKNDLQLAREDAAELEQLIAQLFKAAEQEAKRQAEEEARRQGSARQTYQDDFAAGQGHLRWPLEGKVLIEFGKQRDQQLGTVYDSKGLEIAAAPGSTVQAVAAGRVVFADYFKNYGNLCIVSHPGGYHTLYAQLERLDKNNGAQVSAGDLLGYSGLNGRKSIYFEMRQKGAAIDPRRWLVK